MPGNGQCPPHGIGFQAPERNRLAARQGRHEYGSKLAAGVPLASSQQRDHRLSGPPQDQGASDEARARDGRVSEDSWVSTLLTLYASQSNHPTYIHA
ncbi:hypothetical protein PoB_002029900 [Plakobranchus ocellatus]|uniref:Uncharacterized protein n=1 Tax=Plakobranchus ocellatus TaxID=259542 RepID=A0AAV3ZEI6_9GAST|nr:hypothetical protein PoB_002029900 [Plakobranchus ocellatus]